MTTNSHVFIGPIDEAEREWLESSVRDEYARCNPGDSFAAMKSRAEFSREDRGLYRQWLAVAAARLDVRASALAAE